MIPEPAAASVQPEPASRPASGAAADVARSEARIFAVLSQFAVMQAVLTGTGLIRNKIVAYRLGPTAFGEFSQIAATIGVASALVTFGMGVSVSRNVARSQSIGQRQTHLSNANGIVLSLAAIAVGITSSLLLGGRLLPLAGLHASATLVVTALLFVAAMPVEGLKTNYLALLQGILDVRGLAIRRSVAVVLATAVAIPVVWTFGLVGAGIQYLLLSLFVAALLGSRCHDLGYAALRVRFEPSPVACLASFGIASLASGFAQAFFDTAVRARLIATAGATANGMLQASYALSENVKGIILASIGTISLATISQKTDRAEISRSVDKLLNVVVPLGAAALGLLGLLGRPALTLLYSGAFVSGATFFPYLLVADVFLVFVWVVGAPLLAHGDRVLWLVLDVVYAAGRWGIAVLLMRRLGGNAVVIGYLAAVFLHLLANLAVYRWRYQLAMRPGQLLQLGLGIAFVAALSLVGAESSTGLLARSVAFLVWGAYALHHARRTGVLEAALARLRR